jgi:hypothetical protein
VAKKKPKDLVLVHGRTPDGNGVNVLRARDERLEIGTMRPLEEGRPILGEVVKLTPRPEFPLLFDAQTEFTTVEESPKDAAAKPVAEAARASVGPAQVASESYRRNWDAIWKRPSKTRSALN